MKQFVSHSTNAASLLVATNTMAIRNLVITGAWCTENEAVCCTQHKCSHVAGCYKHDVDQKFSDNRDLVH